MMALDISQSIFAADTEIFVGPSKSIATGGNLIVLGFPNEIGINVRQLRG